MTTCFVNGKFLAQRRTGVQRFATELLLAVDRQLASPREGERRWVLLCPPGAARLALRHIEVRVLGKPGRPLHWWEQCTLPHAARHGLLLNLTGSSPWFGGAEICTLHDAALFDRPEGYTGLFRLWYGALFRRSARRAQRVLTVSEFSRARLAHHLRLDPRAIGVVPNGCDHLERVEADAQVLADLKLRDGRYLLAVASANPNKNLARLVAAFARLPAALRLQLVLVGAGNERVFASDAAPDSSASPLPVGVVQAGALGDEQLKALYQHALALVFPSIYEGFGLPPLEAMACGCPVIVARAAALPEVCGNAALYVDPFSMEDIAAACERLASDAQERERLRDAGLRHASKSHWDQAAGLLRQEMGLQ